MRTRNPHQFCFFCDVLGRWKRGPAAWLVRWHMRHISRVIERKGART